MGQDEMDQRVELVAQAIHEAQPQACSWDAEPAIRREHFRECARNAVKLIPESPEDLQLDQIPTGT